MNRYNNPRVETLLHRLRHGERVYSAKGSFRVVAASPAELEAVEEIERLRQALEFYATINVIAEKVLVE